MLPSSSPDRAPPISLNQRVRLLGLDFGSTTCSAMVAEAYVRANSVTGRMEFSEPQLIFRSVPVFTPFKQDAIDDAAIAALIDEWVAQSGLQLDLENPDLDSLDLQQQDREHRGMKSGIPNLFAGGCIITGLAAQRQNAATIATAIGRRVGESVMATAQDPCLESWLAFMGSCSALSRHHPQTPMINLDIGGGTTNVALGLQGDVQNTGYYFIGARHFQFVAGSYQLTALSPYGLALLHALHIEKSVGETLTPLECEQIMAYYCQALEAIVLGQREFFANALGQQHEQVPFIAMTETVGTETLSALTPSRPKITFSGGVGELLYQYMAGEPLPATTFYGDFGIDLALAIASSTLLSADLQQYVPENRGRATVYGLTLHSTEISGTTLFLPYPASLPLRDLPIVSKLPVHATSAQWLAALMLALRREQGACIQITAQTIAQMHADSPQKKHQERNDKRETLDLQQVKQLGLRIRQALADTGYPAAKPLVILIEANIGKALGNYATNWTRSGLNLVVIDEVPIRNAHFVNIGRMHQQIVPISFFGLH